MKSIKDNLEKFISDIENRTISKNEIVVGFLSEEVIKFLASVSIEVENREIYLSVRAYKHILRDFKKRLKKSVPIDVLFGLYETLSTPHKIFFDSDKKHCNLIYVDSKNELLFKIVVQPNYSSKIGKINTVVTAGIIDESVLKNKLYKEIQNMGGN